MLFSTGADNFISFFFFSRERSEIGEKEIDREPRVRVEFDEPREANCQTIVAETSGSTANIQAEGTREVAARRKGKVIQ